MAEEQEIVKEFQDLRVKYFDLLARLVDMKVPGLIDPVAAACSYGEACHGGTTDAFMTRVQPQR